MQVKKKKRKEAATKIQAVFRGRKVRQNKNKDIEKNTKWHWKVKIIIKPMMKRKKKKAKKEEDKSRKKKLNKK